MRALGFQAEFFRERKPVANTRPPEISKVHTSWLTKSRMPIASDSPGSAEEGLPGTRMAATQKIPEPSWQ